MIFAVYTKQCSNPTVQLVTMKVSKAIFYILSSCHNAQSENCQEIPFVNMHFCEFLNFVMW